MAGDVSAVSERNPERDEETGRFSDHYPDEEFLTAIHECDLPTTTEVADGVGCNRRTAYVRLTELEDREDVTSRKVGTALVWALEEDTDV